MRLTDKLFWVLWAVAQVAIVASCVYDAILNSNIEDASYVFFTCQPLMIILPFFHKRHKLGAIINISVVCAYSVLLCYIRLSYKPFSSWNLYWLVYLIALSMIQFTILAVYWGVERIIKVCKSKSSKDSAD